MALVSQLFRGDAALEACRVNDSAHLVIGTRGPHVLKVQRALAVLDGAHINLGEVSSQTYGSTTARAVLDCKRARAIINFSYQKTADNIVGKMTIAALDREMALTENQPPLRGCQNERQPGFGAGQTGRRVGVGDGPQSPPKILKVVFQNAITPNFGVDRSRPVLAIFARANLLLAAHNMALSFNLRLKPFPFPFPVTPKVMSDAEGLRKAAEKADSGIPGVLRIIFCELDSSENKTTTAYSAGPRVGVNGFPNFVIMNPEINHPDRGTLLHEMVHVSDDSLMFIGSGGHDTDVNSIFSHGENRTVVKREHAALLRTSFFAG